ncbi:MAG: hypothetical protein C5B51_28815 [Terriglobia bacterium]|nr:MAG: hypothetical protein C5B51_28815 [Terriglobia bacterium]
MSNENVMLFLGGVAVGAATTLFVVKKFQSVDPPVSIGDGSLDVQSNNGWLSGAPNTEVDTLQPAGSRLRDVNSVILEFDEGATVDLTPNLVGELNLTLTYGADTIRVTTTLNAAGLHHANLKIQSTQHKRFRKLSLNDNVRSHEVTASTLTAISDGVNTYNPVKKGAKISFYYL